MSNMIAAVVNCDEKNDLRQLIVELRNESQRYLLKNDITICPLSLVPCPLSLDK